MWNCTTGAKVRSIDVTRAMVEKDFTDIGGRYHWRSPSLSSAEQHHVWFEFNRSGDFSVTYGHVVVISGNRHAVAIYRIPVSGPPELIDAFYCSWADYQNGLFVESDSRIYYRIYCRYDLGSQNINFVQPESRSAIGYTADGTLVVLGTLNKS